MKYKHVLFLYPYGILKTTTASVNRLFPPAGLEYIATSAKGYAEKITLLDLRYEEEFSDTDKLIAFIRKEVDIVCVSIGWDREFEEVCALINKMPEGIPVVAGGYKATEQVEELFCLCPKLDMIARGEGEETIRQILSGLPKKDILGISYRQDGKIYHNQIRALPRIDIVEAPDRSLRRTDYSLSFYGRRITNLTFDTVLSARGCPYNCKFCTFNLNPLGQKRPYAERSIASVIEEIEQISADVILFSDDNFATNAKRAIAICDEIIRRKIRKRFLAQVRIEITKHPELIARMVKAGFKLLSFGIESPHDHILAQLGKGFTRAEIYKAFDVLRKFPILYHGYFIYGNIGETEEEMLYISEFARGLGVDTIACNKLRADKFSPLRKIIEGLPQYHLNAKGEVYSDTYSHSALKKINKKIKFGFYTPFKIISIAKKFTKIRFFSLRDWLSLITVAPFLLKHIISREKTKSALRRGLKENYA
ncbi:MAG: radical SAM protein [Candidatus Omnitrophica bacterium]|nr:radical SAM protein [Candidatus Omnitrophota bacterium]